MASKQGSKSKRLGSVSSKAANSRSSSTTSSSKQFLETSIDGQSSPGSSSARSKPRPREIRQGEEIACDRVFGPTTTTRHVYDVAAQHVVSGSMEGINGTIFAYGVTSSGKTHTMHTPNREFLLRVSYLEIYNEVVNDLLNPAGQNLRIREDAQTIESSPCGENSEGQAVNLSQLNLIDLAGSESSKAETTGVRWKEGSYINKSLLTLGTVISKLTDGRASHIPYRDSKLTRLLQSSLSGHGRVSLICTVTPSSGSSEETHNTLKFAHRAKHIEIQAAQNKIIDEKSLIKKYQNEIRTLKEELEQLKKGIVTVPQLKDMGR
ncbi:hypothetical protein GH714_036839 [Hevea brasiliensis]|uniref:Kinesin-like protein n=1 Tax=Hevea brasiliensis TaxID=3981 RepID=A0A6A6KN61_HEVBR|nr:hypothetical protein GH714_036839 [Hevea brasiliensis]